MKLIKVLFWSFVLVVAFGAALYANRFTVVDFVNDVSAPELPEAVSFEEVQEGVLDAGDVAEEVLGEDAEVLSDEGVDDEIEEGVVEEDVAEDDSEDVLEEEVEIIIEEEVTDDEVAEEEEVTLPASVNLAVPFTSQAPHGVWANPYKEACEEASLYMAHQYFEGSLVGTIDADVADRDLVEMVSFEMDLFGYFEDTTVEQTALIAEMLYGYQTLIIEDPTAEQIQEQLAAGRPVLVPAAGRLLGNPYFTAPGPLYHMLIIRGYTASNQFIVNDPGTKRGESYVYGVDTIMNAVHDWNNGNEITEGAKRVLVVYP
ncbi:MAG: C39 family peptidase [bacterium]|nr:C39 family peptidase [bacterium]